MPDPKNIQLQYYPDGTPSVLRKLGDYENHIKTHQLNMWWGANPCADKLHTFCKEHKGVADFAPFLERWSEEEMEYPDNLDPPESLETPDSPVSNNLKNKKKSQIICIFAKKAVPLHSN